MRLHFFLVLFFLQFTVSTIPTSAQLHQDSSVTENILAFEMDLQKHPILIEKKPTSYKQHTAIPRKAENKTPIFIIAIIMFAVFAFTRLAFSKYIQHLFQLFTLSQAGKRQIKDQLENNDRASVWLTFLYLLSTTIILYFWLLKFSTLSPYLLFIIGFFAIFLFIVCKNACVQLIAWVFDARQYVASYLFTKKRVNEFMALLLFPLSILLLISSGNTKMQVMIVAVILYGCMLLFSFVKNFPLLTNLFRIRILHFLLYLCAFEVVPILVLLKLIV
jgi:hypothetical protein